MVIWDDSKLDRVVGLHRGLDDNVTSPEGGRGKASDKGRTLVM